MIIRWCNTRVFWKYLALSRQHDVLHDLEYILQWHPGVGDDVHEVVGEQVLPGDVLVAKALPERLSMKRSSINGVRFAEYAQCRADTCRMMSLRAGGQKELFTTTWPPITTSRSL